MFINTIAIIQANTAMTQINQRRARMGMTGGSSMSHGGDCAQSTQVAKEAIIHAPRLDGESVRSYMKRTFRG